ncbi:hypothetical protein [Rhodopirellula sp. MGV]|uniref:hypothetical protein n=1 Tax=Rhodopirellula sp. MGV TaxID=2023130 RepID=UPI000B97780F|nr:hypothetical protein [Rhodopirellula sp. MGV]OYP31065.1 hypothetical protein CGZ80_22110 [Rhodopirellula sp. MGV]PNY36519.1 hypothetical protein C2E31_11685 [Rhodopirellula baltica]PNY38238.1 hypothetical protein C2E31_04400 [Rhodopirellula baltica]
MSETDVIDASALAELKKERSTTLVPEMHQWILSGVVAAAARFIPVPFVDDFVKSKCRKHVVTSALSGIDRSKLRTDFSTMYSEPGGILSGTAAMAAKIPIKLLLFPVRKIVAVMTSVRGVPLEVIRCVLLGRTVQRFAEKTSQPGGVAVDGNSLRQAFDSAFSRMDFRVVRAVVGDALSGIERWSDAAIEMAKSIATQQSDAPLEQQDKPAVEASVQRIEQSLNQPKVMQLFSDFDSKLDAKLLAIEAKNNRR